jgi:predicted metal-dependent phosphoesterase TrpH
MGKADLHIHTNHSYDGISTPQEVLERAKELDIDVIAICDHDEISGALEAQKLSVKYGVEVIIGEEVLTNEGEVIGLFLKKKIEVGKTLHETVKEIRKQDGLVVIPHPFAIFPVTRPAVSIKKLYDLFKEKGVVPDALEVLNSMPAGKVNSKKSKRLNDKVFTVAEVAGSDAHIKSHIGMSVTVFEGNTKEELRKAILEEKTKVEGDFISKRQSAEYLGKNIAKIGKKAKNRITGSYQKIKDTIHNRFYS